MTTWHCTIDSFAMPRSLGRASLVLLGSTWTHSALGLLISVMIARVLGPTAVGTLALNLGLAGLAMAALLPGFAQAHLKKLAEGQDAGRCIGAMLLIQGTLTAALVVAGLLARRAGAIADAPGGAAVVFGIPRTQAAGRVAALFLTGFLARGWPGGPRRG